MQPLLGVTVTRDMRHRDRSRFALRAIARASWPAAASAGLSLAVSTLSGCYAKPTLPLSYTFAIDPGFTADETESIMGGLDAWSASVPELKLDRAIATCDAASPQRVCIGPSYAPVDTSDDIVGTTYLGVSDSATVILYVDRIDAMGGDTPMLRQQTAAHEIGHAFGLKHTTAGELMAPFVVQQAPTITPADVAQFWSMR